MKTPDFLSFALIISSNESKSKTQFNLQNLGENESGYLSENRIFPQMKTSRKVYICLH